MATSRERNRLTRLAGVLASSATALAWVGTASASQGPGVTAGTASHLTQVMMAALVYGLSALVVASGLIGALRQH